MTNGWRGQLKSICVAQFVKFSKNIKKKTIACQLFQVVSKHLYILTSIVEMHLYKCSKFSRRSMNALVPFRWFECICM